MKLDSLIPWSIWSTLPSDTQREGESFFSQLTNYLKPEGGFEFQMFLYWRDKLILADHKAQMERDHKAQLERLRNELKPAQSDVASPDLTLNPEQSVILRDIVWSVYGVPAGQATNPKETDDEALSEVLKERDDAEDFIDTLLDVVLGDDREEWSNAYGWDEALEDVKAFFPANESTTVQPFQGDLPKSPTPPPFIGEYWQGQGGIYAGVVGGHGVRKDYHLILCPHEPLKQLTWQDAADFAKFVTPDGHRDSSVPTTKEFELLQVNLRYQLSDVNVYWTSTTATPDKAWTHYPYQGRQEASLKTSQHHFRFVRRLAL